MRKFLSAVVAGLATVVVATVPSVAEDVVNVYNWSDYIDEETNPSFEKKTGVRVRYDLFDSLETLETKMLTGGAGYDVIVPTSSVAERLIKVGALQPLDRSKIPNYKNLDPALMAELSKLDPENKYVVPYMWGTIGLGINTKLVNDRIKDAPVDSLDLIFKPEYAEKLADCGIGMIDTPSEVSIIALNYLGLDPYTTDKAEIKKAEDMLLKVRKNFRYFKSTGYLDDLANGEICVFLGYSVDMFQVMATIEEAKSDIKVEYTIPKEGSIIYFDTLAIPSDAPNADAAHKWINHILDPQVAANLSNYLVSANGNIASQPLIDEAVRTNKSVYPSPEVQAKLRSDITVDQKTVRARTRMMTRVKTDN